MRVAAKLSEHLESYGEDAMKAADLGKPVRVFLTGCSFVFFWTGGAVLALVVVPFEAQRQGSPAEKRRRFRGWEQWGFRLFHDFMKLWGLTDFDHRKVDLQLPDGPYLMVANHPTLVDVTAILSAVGDVAVVVKGSYWRTSMARLLGACGHIDGGDGSPLAAGSVAVQALEKLADGQAVLIFPEGTRSPEDGLHPFQRGAFEIARRAGVPVVPVFVTSDPAWLMKHQRWWQVPNRMNRMRLRLLPNAKVEVPVESSKVVVRRYDERYRGALDGWLRNHEGSGMVRELGEESEVD